MPIGTVHDVVWNGASRIPSSLLLTKDEARSIMLRGLLPRDCVIAWAPQCNAYIVVATPPRLPPGAVRSDKERAYTLTAAPQTRDTDTPPAHPTPASNA